MAQDIFEAIKSCMHCGVVNLTNHEAQQFLKSIKSQAPFDIVAFDAPAHGKSSGEILNVILYAECVEEIKKVFDQIIL